MRLIRFAPLLPLLLAMSSPQAVATADDAELLQAVHAFLHEEASSLGDELIIEVRPPSARLPVCEFPEPFLARSGDVPLGRVSVGVRCGNDGRQVRYLQAEIGAMGEYPVLDVPLGVGETVRREHLVMQTGNLAELPHRALLDPTAIVGQVATRPLTPGQPLLEHQFRSLPLVERNQRVVVEARGSAFRVTREGQALEPGGLGDRVRVRFDSREIVTAAVAGEGVLVVDF